MTIDIPLKLLTRLVEYAKKAGHYEAGVSQAPELILYENTQGFKDAAEVRRIIKDKYNPKQ